MSAQYASRSERDIAQLALTLNYILAIASFASSNNGGLGATKHTVSLGLSK